MDRRGDRRRPSQTALAVSCIVGFSLTASILVLLVPTVFGSDHQVHPLVVAVLVAVCSGCAAGAWHWRPRATSSDR